MIYWFIGQPGCGKTTLAKMLKKHFDNIGNPTIHLDGDDLRVIFGGTYKTEHFTKEYRDTNTRKLQAFVEHVEKQGIDVVVSTVNGNRDIREELKSRNPRVVEVYVQNTKPHVREDRAYFDFESPVDNCVVIDTGNYLSLEETFTILLEKLYHEEKSRMETESPAISHKKG